ncbi:MAG: hypothetical protein WC515_06010 [Candidatus Omnitrophota bacterium]
MCCEICPRYVSCEEEGHLDNTCCTACPEQVSCSGGEASDQEETAGEEDELNDI